MIPHTKYQGSQTGRFLKFASTNVFSLRMAISGDPMCVLHIVRKGHCHQAIHNFIEEAETSHRSSLFKGLLVQLRLQ